MPPPRPTTPATERPTLRRPTLDDGAAMWRLVRDCGGLDLNAPYAYLLVADRFAATSVVAEVAGELRGVVVGLPLPDDPTGVFVWQVGVAPPHRGGGLGRRMLHHVVATTGARTIEASVAPSNTASRRLFQRLAADLATRCEVTPWLTPEHFPPGDHDAEDRYRIGPIDAVPA